MSRSKNLMKNSNTEENSFNKSRLCMCSYVIAYSNGNFTIWVIILQLFITYKFLVTQHKNNSIFKEIFNNENFQVSCRKFIFGFVFLILFIFFKICSFLIASATAPCISIVSTDGTFPVGLKIGFVDLNFSIR